MNGSFKDGYAHAGAAEIGAIKKCQVAMKLHAAAARLNVVGVQVAQFLRERFLQSACAGCEELH